MSVTYQPIMGVSVGFEFTEQEINNELIGYLLIDLFIIRIQCAWYKE